MPFTPDSTYHRTLHRAAAALAAYVAILLLVSFTAGCSNTDQRAKAGGAGDRSAGDGQQAKLTQSGDDRPAGASAKSGTAGIGPAGGAAGTGEAPSAERSADIDLQKMQGTWERIVRPDEQVPYKRVVKHIQGNQETVTYYGPHNEVQRATVVEFRLERLGAVKVFTYANMRITAGADAGKVSDAKQSYIYRLTDHEFSEVWGFLAGQEARPISYHVHVRAQPGDTGAYPENTRGIQAK